MRRCSRFNTTKRPTGFGDAKFGIWSHWGPNAVPGQGDWYARRMYIEGHPQYIHHLENYGHPSTHGYKDIIPLWKAEKWNPEELMELYVKAGAKYFVSMASFHDNFDLWNSKFQRWNSVEMGPQRDVVGQWQAAAQKHGLRFGVSEHLSASYLWFQPSHGADKNGPLAGVPYDGADPRFAGLYQVPDRDIDETNQPWFTSNPDSHQDWARRMKDLLLTYHPDLLYTDGAMPFGEVGRDVIADFYNDNMRQNNGQLEAVYSYKRNGLGEYIQGMGVLDIERGGLQGINPLPWQTDTSIGDWFYSENYLYKTTTQVIHLLADIVSKNGNLLLNVVQYADGSFATRIAPVFGGDGAVDADQRRGDLWHAALESVGRKPKPKRDRTLPRGRVRLQRAGHPFHHQKRRALRADFGRPHRNRPHQNAGDRRAPGTGRGAGGEAARPQRNAKLEAHDGRPGNRNARSAEPQTRARVCCQRLGNRRLESVQEEICRGQSCGTFKMARGLLLSSGA